MRTPGSTRALISEADAKARSVEYRRDCGWYLPEVDGPVSDGLVVWAQTETVELAFGWCWWALGRMGDSASYEDACAKVERIVLGGRHP
jgi:hypothetical protein